ncbi:fimbrial protein [Pseudomonas palleroniana]
MMVLHSCATGGASLEVDKKQPVLFGYCCMCLTDRAAQLEVRMALSCCATPDFLSLTKEVIKMKRQVIAVSLLMIASSIQVANAASDGTISFSGGISSTTCTVTVNGGTSGSTTVTLPTVGMAGMTSVGVTKGATALNFSLSGCTASSGTAAASATIAFQGGDGISSGGNVLNTYMPSSSAASGIVLQIKDASNQAVVIGNAPTSADYSPLSSGGMTKSYTVQYLTTSAAPVAGYFSGAVTYSISYL